MTCRAAFPQCPALRRFCDTLPTCLRESRFCDAPTFLPVRRYHPLIPPALAIPSIIFFCASTYTIITGTSAISVPAIKRA